MEPRKLVSRSNRAQIEYLCQYMSSHQSFAAGEFNSSRGTLQQKQQWAALKLALDELGPTRSVEQWKICWRDQKRKARVEGGALNKAMGTTGNVVPIPEISQNASLILETIGQEMAWGCGPAESQIGFGGPSTSSYVPLPQQPALLSPILPPTTPRGLPHMLPSSPTEPELLAPAAPTLLAPAAPTPLAPATPTPLAPVIPTPLAPVAPTPLAQAVPAPSAPSLAPARALRLVPPTGRGAPLPVGGALPRANRPTARRHTHVSHPPDRFINAQIELNLFMKEIVGELRLMNGYLSILSRQHYQGP